MLLFLFFYMILYKYFRNDRIAYYSSIIADIDCLFCFYYLDVALSLVIDNFRVY